METEHMLKFLRFRRAPSRPTELSLNIEVSAVVEPDGDRFYAFCPGLRGLHADGDTEEQALEHLKECLGAYFVSLVKHGEPLPMGPDVAVLTRREAIEQHDPA